MIIASDDLERYQRRVAMVDGGFDPLHKGHIEYFRTAAETLGVPLLCNVASDAYLVTKHPPFLPERQRLAIVDAIRYIDLTHLNRTTTADVLRRLRPLYYVKGADWRGKLPPEQVEVARELDIEIVYLDTVSDSSTRILDRYLRGSGGPRRANMPDTGTAPSAPTPRGRQAPAKVSVDETPMTTLDQFEAFVLNQTATSASHYDEDYFTAEWRAGGNSYTVAARRPIEGQNPRLIKEVFGAGKILDVGCGPGALMYLLHELGVGADGIDFSPQCRELAPPEVRDRIMLGSVADPLLVPDDAYDLVICREVIEHLTVLQARQLVSSLCRVSANYVYVTTRFHPDPASLFDVTHERHVDPTHITAMHKDLLRLMFILEGFKRRPDLEARMDWLNKHRVLVYQQAEVGE